MQKKQAFEMRSLNKEDPRAVQGGLGRRPILKTRVFLILFCCILFLVPGTARALDPAKEFFQFHLGTWKMEGDLIDNIVYCSLQDSNGYIWLGTTRGLVRFDGVRFKSFDKNVPEQLTKYLVRTLYEDRDHNIWIGTDGGLIKFGSDGFTVFTTKEGLPHNLITALYGDSKGNLWIGTDGGGLTVLRDGRFFTYTTSDGLSSNFLKCIREDGNGDIRVGTRKGLDRLTGGKINPSSAAAADPELDSLVMSILDDREGNLWLGTNEGLKKLSGGNVTSFTQADGMTDSIVLNLFRDRAGILWIGTGAGLYRMKNGKFSKLSTEDGLFGNAVNSILEDREGSLWIGTVDGGLNRLKDVSFTTYTTRQGLPDDMVRCVMEDSRGSLWVGTSEGLSRWRQGEWTSFNPARSGPGNYISSMLEDRGGTLWLGTKDGLYRGDREKGIFSLFAGEKRFGGYVISSLLEDRAGTLWVGTLGIGLHCYKNKEWYKYTTENGLSNNYVKCLHEDAAGDIWIGTQEGLNRLAPGPGTFTIYNASHGLAHDAVTCIYEDKEGTFWIGTRNGPTRFRGGIFFPYYHLEEFLNNGVFTILEDTGGYLWMSSNKGIFRVWKKELNDLAAGETVVPEVRFFNEADGLKSRVCNGGTQPAGWKSKDGKLWFPTISGAAVVEPGRLIRNRQPPPVLVEEIIIDDKEVAGLSGVTRGKGVFAPGVKNLEFHYTALSYLQPEKVCFKYRLQGYDTGWVNAGTRRTAYYTNLSPGNYIFRVIASNNDGIWNSDGASFDFYLKPFFYQTAWFFVFCCIVIIVGAGVLYRWRVRALKNHKKELELLVDERTRQLKIANRKLSETNKELKQLASLDGLTGIYNYRWFSEFLDIEWKRAARMRKHVTVILIDVDFFKLYNDTYGHQEGDECLRRIARRLKEECRRPGDVVARYGGEEFIVLLLDATSDIAAGMAERLWNGIRQLSIPHLTSRVSKYVTISLGSATAVPGSNDDPASLIKVADNALYESKQTGRNRITVKVEV